MPSEHFERFYKSFVDTGFHSVRDGLDFDALDRLDPSEKETVEMILVHSLGSALDVHSRPVIALGYLRARSAVEPLKMRLQFTTGADRVFTALALYQIEGFAEAADILIEVLRLTPLTDQWARLRAVDALGNLERTDQALTALLEALEDPDTLVGYYAADALKKLLSSDGLQRRIATIQQASVGPGEPDPEMKALRCKQIQEFRAELGVPSSAWNDDTGRSSASRESI